MNATQIHECIQRAQRLIVEVLESQTSTQCTGSDWLNLVIPNHSISEVFDAARSVPQHGKQLFEHLVNLSVLYSDYKSSKEICKMALDYNIINEKEYLFHLSLIHLNMYKIFKDEIYLRKGRYYIYRLLTQHPDESADKYYILALYYWLTHHPLTSMIAAIHASFDSHHSGLLFVYIIQVLVDKGEIFLADLYKDIVNKLSIQSLELAYSFSKVWLIYLYFGLLLHNDIGHFIKNSLNNNYVKNLSEILPYYTGEYYRKMLKGEVKAVWPAASLN